MISFTHAAAGLLPSDLDHVEQQFAFCFPQAVREHYLGHNGGCPDKNRFSNERGTYTVDSFIPVKSSALPTVPTLEIILERLKTVDGATPWQLVPFADDPCGNFYCFSVRQEDFGAIYWFEAEGYGKHRTEFLARSLGDFLANLKCKDGE